MRKTWLFSTWWECIRRLVIPKARCQKNHLGVGLSFVHPFYNDCSLSSPQPSAKILSINTDFSPQYTGSITPITLNKGLLI